MFVNIALILLVLTFDNCVNGLISYLNGTVDTTARGCIHLTRTLTGI